MPVILCAPSILKRTGNRTYYFVFEVSGTSHQYQYLEECVRGKIKPQTLPESTGARFDVPPPPPPAGRFRSAGCRKECRYIPVAVLVSPSTGFPATSEAALPLLLPFLPAAERSVCINARTARPGTGTCCCNPFSKRLSKFTGDLRALPCSLYPLQAPFGVSAGWRVALLRYF
jgi:hypothetical protein